MAQSPPKPATKSASSAGKSPPKSGGFSRIRLSRKALIAVGGTVLVAVLAAGVVVYLVRTGRIGSVSRLIVVKDFGPESKGGGARPGQGPAQAGAPAPGEEHTYTVKPGENLWKIAKEGTLVSSPWEWRTILVQNKDKIQYAFLSEEDGGWKVILDEGQQLKVKGGVSAALPDGQGKVGPQYAVQLLTVPEDRMERGMRIVRLLITDGYFAYLYRHEEQGKRFFRIRVGFYGTEDEAKQAGQALIARYGKLFREYWAMRPSDEELKGQHLDFGVQQSRPWVVELPQRDSHHDALEDLRKVVGASEFAYISQKRDGTASPAHYIYRTRIGFFASEEDARTFVAAHKGSAPLLSDGRPVRVDNFLEAFPGQNIKMGKAG